MTLPNSRKRRGAYYTPETVVSSLVRWARRGEHDRMLDPACGDGRFLAGHRNSVGIEQHAQAAEAAVARAPSALVHHGDFFAWAALTNERFDCAAGNPPFIRYQTFKGETRVRALDLCAAQGARFSRLTSSWAPFLVATASLLKPGGRMAFVVPAEIGHAPYAAPLLEYLVQSFATVQVVAIREKLFPGLSEDCWLLFASGFGGSSSTIELSIMERFAAGAEPPRSDVSVCVTEWRKAWNCRLRPYLLPRSVREIYRVTALDQGAIRFGDIASIGIGYVTGANEFFHLRPSEAIGWDIPDEMLRVTVRTGASLPARRLTRRTVESWVRTDEPMLLLHIPKDAELPDGVAKYLGTDRGREARNAYKCRVRDPWYSVPHVKVPDFFLTYMCGREPSLVRNSARVTCTNAVHCVQLHPRAESRRLHEWWGKPFVQLSCELEGHPLGGGMLKLEPGEASRVVFPSAEQEPMVTGDSVRDAVSTMRAWRHHGVG